MSLSRIIHHSHSFTRLEIYNHIYFMIIYLLEIYWIIYLPEIIIIIIKKNNNCP